MLIGLLTTCIVLYIVVPFFVSDKEVIYVEKIVEKAPEVEEEP